MRKPTDKLAQEIAGAANNWIVPGSIRVKRYAEIICNNPDQVISRPLVDGAEIPEENDMIFFSSDEADIPAFVDESEFEAYCKERGLDDMAFDGLFSSVSYQIFGATFAGEEVFLGGYGNLEQVEAVRTAIAGPTQALLDAGLLAEPQQPDAAPEL